MYGGELMSAIEFYLKEMVNGMDVDEKTKQELYEEFFNHLNSSKLNYMKQGMFEDEAEKMCIQDFGEGKVIGKQLQKNMFPKKHFFHKLAWVLFIVYIVSVLYKIFIGSIISFPNGSWETERFYGYQFAMTHGISQGLPSFNLIPFKTIFSYLVNFGDYNFAIVFKFLIGNIVVFIPLGIFLLILFPTLRVKRYFVIWVSLFLIGIELIQFFSMLGTGDIDAVILRMIGSLIGVLLYEKARTIQISFGTKVKDLV